MIRSRLDDMPAYAIEAAQIDAGHYNQIRLALLRLGGGIRLDLPGLRGLDAILEEDCWVCVDRTLNDVPVIAWLEFDSRGRSDLQAPVSCTLKRYHAHADMICERVLDIILEQLAQRLHPESDD